MSVLDNVLREEYDRLQRMRAAMVREYDELPQGYISKKMIRGRPCYYLQRRDGAKIVSSFVAVDGLPELQGKIEKRNKLKASIKEIDLNLKKLKRVIK